MKAPNGMRALIAVALAAMVSGCNVTDQSYPDVDAVGKQIVADWKELPEVVEAKYEYRHGLDQGQVLYVDATVKQEAVTTSVERLEEIARRDYWRGTSQNVTLHVAVFSEAKPPATGPTAPDNAVHRNRIELSDKAELEKKYGPRPAKK